MKRFPPIAASFLAAVPALAGPLECTFSKECFETEACYETEYGFMVWFPSETTESVVTVSDVNGDYPGEALPLSKGGIVVRFTSDFGPSLLTVQGGIARFSAHGVLDAMMLNYLGACKELED